MIRDVAPRGLARSRDLQSAGLSRVAVARLADSGKLQRIARGVYASPDFAPTEHHGLATAAARVPHAVICLLSALQFHSIGTQAPFEVWIAIDRKARKPTVDAPPLRVVRFSSIALREGVEQHEIEGVHVNVTSAARTVADCFKYRNKIGLDVALEALREYRRSKRPVEDLVRAAEVVRVSSVLRPYLEAVTA
jgi:predicted transcriptional regulator of viral defense system